MKVDFMSTSILLFCILSSPILADVLNSTEESVTDSEWGIGDYMRIKPTEQAAVDGDASNATSESAPEVSTPEAKTPEVKTSKVPTTPKIEVSTMNPNITYIEQIQINSFMESTNYKRDQHLLGQWGYVWTWDPSLVESAISRLSESCDVEIDNTDVIKEVLFTSDEWKKSRRDKKTIYPKMVSLIYSKGAARVGCVGRIGCDGNNSKDNKIVFCHFAPSNFSTDPDFNKGSEWCTFDKTYTGLCIDAPEPVITTEQPIKIIYKYKVASRFDLMMAMVTVLVAKYLN